MPLGAVRQIGRILAITRRGWLAGTGWASQAGQKRAMNRVGVGDHTPVHR